MRRTFSAIRARALAAALPGTAARFAAIACMFVVSTCWTAPSLAGPVNPAFRLLGIQGHDDRQTVENSAYPWRAIGRLNNKGAGFCTGVLIGERKVLTAAHCLRRRGGRGTIGAASNIHFLAGYSRGHYLAHSRAVSIARSPERGTTEKTHDDWAIVTLEKPLGRTIGFLPLERFDASAWQQDQRRGQRYIQAGYSQDRQHILTRHLGCSIVGFFRGYQAFAHQCDATHGDSGSPILVERGGRYRVVGLHVATSRQKGYGVAISGARILHHMGMMAMTERRLAKR